MKPLVSPAVNSLLLLGAACSAVGVFWWFPVLYVRAYERRIPDLSVIDDRSGGIWFLLLQATLGASVYGSVAFVRMRKAASRLDERTRNRFMRAGAVLLIGSWSWCVWPLMGALWKVASLALKQ